RFDAVSRLLAPSGRMAAKSVRRPRKSGSDCVSQAAKRSRSYSPARHADDRRGIHFMAFRFAAHLCWRTWLRPQMEHGVDERYASLLRAGSDSSQVPPRRTDVLDALCLQREFYFASLA